MFLSQFFSLFNTFISFLLFFFNIINSQFSNLGIQDTTSQYTTDYIDTTNKYNLNNKTQYNNQYMRTYKATTKTIEIRNLFD